MNKVMESNNNALLFDCNMKPCQDGDAKVARIFNEWTPEQSDIFGKKPFVIGHTLAECELFELPRLQRLARDTYAARKAGRVKDAQLKPRRDGADGDDMSSWESKMAVGFSDSEWEAQLAEMFSEIERDATGFSMMISCANEVDPAYDSLMRQALLEIAERTRLSLPDISFAGLTVIITAPGAITPYHNDHEWNFLFQIQGGKDVYIFDQDDPFILPQVAVENSCVANGGAAYYRKEFEGLGTVYRLEPGLAVHIPPLAPHWVKNGDNVSISVSIPFSARERDDLSRVHQANWFLRRIGLKQPAPDLSRVSDRFKAKVFHLLSGSRRCHDDLFRGVYRLRWPDRRARAAWGNLRAGRSVAK